jgi:glucokinase
MKMGIMKEFETIGVDIGGSHISAGKVYFGQAAVSDVEVIRKGVNSLGKESEILYAWVACLEELGVNPYSKLGIAMPAPFDYVHGISLIKDQGKFLSLYGKNIRKILAERLSIPEDHLAFINDAAAFLQGEAQLAGWGAEDHLMGLTLGTGLGSAFKKGHFAEDAALWSSPFKAGIAEDYLSTAYFSGWAKLRFGREIKGLKELLDDPETHAATLEALDVFGKNLGEFICLHIKETGIDKVIIGGNMVKAAELFLPQAKDYVNQKNLYPEIITSRLGEKAALIGAASINYAS